MIRIALFSVIAAALAAPALAGDLSILVTTPDGKPVADAVATIPAQPGAPKPNFPWNQAITQKDKQFRPFVLITPVNASVSFPNLDPFRHQIYSFSKGNKFELDLYGQEEQRSHVFTSVGVAALGCNIHDEMVAFVKVVDTPWAAKTDAAGKADIKGAPEGQVKVTVWHPYAKAKGQETVLEALIAPGANTLQIVLDVSAPHHH